MKNLGKVKKKSVSAGEVAQCLSVLIGKGPGFTSQAPAWQLATDSRGSDTVF